MEVKDMRWDWDNRSKWKHSYLWTYDRTTKGRLNIRNTKQNLDTFRWMQRKRHSGNTSDICMIMGCTVPGQEYGAHWITWTKMIWPKYNGNLFIWSGFYLANMAGLIHRFMYEPSLHIPLIVRYPQKIQAENHWSNGGKYWLCTNTFRLCRHCDTKDHSRENHLGLLLESKQPIATGAKSMYYHYYEYPGPHRVMPHLESYFGSNFQIDWVLWKAVSSLGLFWSEKPIPMKWIIYYPISRTEIRIKQLRNLT